MNRSSHIIALVFSSIFSLVTAGLWVDTLYATHSLRYSCGSSYVQVVADRGIVQVEVTVGGASDRGFEMDRYRRAAVWGKEELDMFKPKSGIGAFFADIGFATWPYVEHFGSFEGFPGRVFFIPLWFILIFPVSVLAWHGTALARKRSHKALEETPPSVMPSAAAAFVPAGIAVAHL